MVQSLENEIDLIRNSILSIINSEKDIIQAVKRLIELGYKVEDQPVETGQRGQLWRQGKEFYLQIDYSEGNPRHAPCVLIEIAEVPRLIRKMKLSKLFNQNESLLS